MYLVCTLIVVVVVIIVHDLRRMFHSFQNHDATSTGSTSLIVPIFIFEVIIRIIVTRGFGDISYNRWLVVISKEQALMLCRKQKRGKI